VASGRFWQQERAVAEFVPEVVVVDCFAIRHGHQLRSSDGLQQQKVRGTGVVPSGDQAVDHTSRVIRPEYQVGPARRGQNGAVGACGGLQSAGHRGADGDHPVTGGVRQVDQVRGARGHLERLGRRRFARLR
jgi:hypothetical protein